MSGDPGPEAGGAVGEEEAGRDGESLRWSVHPLREGGGRLVVALLSIPLLAAAAWLSGGSVIWGLFAAAILFLALSRYFFPTVYTLTTAGVEARFPLRCVRRPWSDFSSWKVERNGVFLSPYARPTRRENFRGLFLHGRVDREEIAEFVRKRVEGRRS